MKSKKTMHIPHAPQTRSKPQAQPTGAPVKLDERKMLTTTEVAELLQVDGSSVVKWSNDKLLKTYSTPGGHRRIRIPDLREFMTTHGMYIPPELAE